ncbi:hypothetical protein [Kitasatospora cineracea]
MDRNTIADLISARLDAYFEEVDPEDADTDDMAWSVLSHLERAGAINPTD